MATFRVMLTMHIHPGREDEFERAWMDGSDVIATQPANLSHTLARGTEDPGTYFIVSEWTDQASFRAYESSPEHLAHRTRLHPYRSHASMATMTVVHDLGRRPRRRGHAT